MAEEMDTEVTVFAIKHDPEVTDALCNLLGEYLDDFDGVVSYDIRSE